MICHSIPVTYDNYIQFPWSHSHILPILCPYYSYIMPILWITTSCASIHISLGRSWQMNPGRMGLSSSPWGYLNGWFMSFYFMENPIVRNGGWLGGAPHDRTPPNHSGFQPENPKSNDSLENNSGFRKSDSHHKTSSQWLVVLRKKMNCFEVDGNYELDNYWYELVSLSHWDGWELEKC